MRSRVWLFLGLALFVCPAIAVESGRAQLTEDGGQPVGNNQNSRTAGENGPVTLDNFHLLQKLARFDRERIPERVVHARGVGAHGEFVSYDDFSKLTKAKLLSEKGLKTPVFVRFSTVIHPSGSPEFLRDPRGFAVKFYTQEGVWDLVGNNLPVFFIRDAMKFPDMVHSLKPSPITNQQDPNRFFDFFSHVPESTHMLTQVYSDLGTPASLRQMDGFGVHAFKWVNALGQVHYVKFNWRSQQGIQSLSAKEASIANAENHSGHTEDLYRAIREGNFPRWELRVQIIRENQLNDFEFNPLDATKVWPNIPETKVGIMTLNRIPSNFYQFSEQVAFSPAMVVPGIEASEDRLLQGRLFSYADTQRYRLGANYLMLPVNQPTSPVENHNQGGSLNIAITQSDVNYEPSVSHANLSTNSQYDYSRTANAGAIIQQPISKTANFQQAGDFFRAMTPEQQDHLISNLAGDLSKVTNETVKLKMLSHFYQADRNFAERLATAIGLDLNTLQRMLPNAADSISISVSPSAARIAVAKLNPAPTSAVIDSNSKAKVSDLAFQSARDDDLQTISECLQSGLSVNERNARGDTLLIVAAYHQSHSVLKQLLARSNIQIDTINRMGLTAISAAAFKGDLEGVRLLLASNAKVNVANGSGQTPLMFAALAGEQAVVQLLIENGANSRSKDASGNTALSLAMDQGAHEVVEFLKKLTL